MSRTAVIMQPTYLPWVGYFDLMDQADVFVFLDTVQFARRSWQQRNRIRTAKGLEWLTVPVRAGDRDSSPVGAVAIAPDHGFPRKHWLAIEQNYRGAPFFATYAPDLAALLAEPGPSLAPFTIRAIRWLARSLGIATRCEMASALGAQGRRSDLLVDICRGVGADRYLSPMGAAGYIADDMASCWQGREVRFQQYEHPVYHQVFSPFLPYASAIDLLLNEGPRSLEILRSGRRPSIDVTAARQALPGAGADGAWIA